MKNIDAKMAQENWSENEVSGLKMVLDLSEKRIVYDMSGRVQIFFYPTGVSAQLILINYKIALSFLHVKLY